MPVPPITIASYQFAYDLLGSVPGSKFKHVISINNPTEDPPRPLRNHPGRHLVLHFHDTTRGSGLGGVPPRRRDVAQILEFARGIGPDDPVLVHCTAGISRSSAAALAVIASKLEPSRSSAQRAFRELLDVKDTIRPNTDMVALADAQLGYGGELVACWHRVWGGSELIWMPPELADLEPEDFDE